MTPDHGASSARPRVFGMIPAAGRSRRMTSDVPKQLMPFGDRVVLECAIEAMLGADLDGLVVVTRSDVADELDLTEDPRFLTAINDEAGSEMIDSIRVGLAALAAARDELLAAAALVPPEERSSVAVCGTWTLVDVIGHVADWETLGAAGLRHMAGGQAPSVEHVTDIDAWNAAHAEARRDQPWEVVWEDVHAARVALLEVLKGMSQAAMAQSFSFPWRQEGTPHQWTGIFAAHDRDHASDLL